MSEINMKDAPVGYIAVKPESHTQHDRGQCSSCDFEATGKTPCWMKSSPARSRCFADVRLDRQ